MGFFKTMKAAQQTAKAGMEMQAHYQAQQDAAQKPVDPNDPRYAPIHGVTCDKYAEISAGLAKHGVMGPENVAKFAEAAGVPEGKWQEVQVGWTQRMSQHQEVATRYGHIYNKFLN